MGSHERRNRTRLTGPIIPRQPRIKSSASDVSKTSQPGDSPFYRWPGTARGQIVLDKHTYDRVHALLLRLDFSNNVLAGQSTKKWLSEVSVTAGATEGWGETITGRRTEVAPNGAAAGQSMAPAASAGEVNDLSTSIVRKKRKPESAPVGMALPELLDAAPAVNVLGSTMVRKKPKVS